METTLLKYEPFFKSILAFAQGVSDHFGTGFLRLDLIFASILALTFLQVARYFALMIREERVNKEERNKAKLNKSVDSLAERLSIMTKQHVTVNDFLRSELGKIRGALKDLREGIEISNSYENQENLFQFQEQYDGAFQGELD